MDLTTLIASAAFSRQNDSGGDSEGSSGGEDAAAAASELSAGDWIQAGIIVGVGVVLAFAAAWAVKRLVKRRNEMLAALAGRFAATIVFIIAFVYGLNSVGVAVGPLVGGLGIGGLAVAFALKSILSNVLAGILIQLRQPFQVGDIVKLAGYHGKIEAVSLRTVDIETLDGEYVLLPASSVIENPIENWTTTGERREEVIVGIPYDIDADRAAEGIKAAVDELDVILDDKATKVVFTEFGGSSVNLRILAWHKIDDHFLDVKHAMAIATQKWCNDNGGIPFPIRTLEFADPEVLRKVGAGSSSDSPSDTDSASRSE